MVLKEINLIIDIDDGIIQDFNIIGVESVRMKDPEIQRICTDSPRRTKCPHCLKDLEFILHLAGLTEQIEYLEDENDDETVIEMQETDDTEIQEETQLKHEENEITEFNEEYIEVAIEDDRKKESRIRKEEQALLDREFCCPSCDKCFRNKAGLITHLRNCKYGPAMEYIKTEKKPKISRQEKHQNALLRGDYYCNLCNKIFKNSAALIAHTKTCTGHDIRCDLCGAMFESRKKLSKHMSVAHNKMSHVCFVCGSAFKAKWLLEEHVARHSDPKPFKCDICKKGFSSKETIKIHVKANHLSSFVGFKCDLCEKVYATNAKLNRHLQTRHHSTGSYICSLCSAKFGTDKALEQHIFNIHTPSDEKILYKCTSCNHTATSQTRIEKHQLLHADPSQWPFGCKVCGKRFIQKHSMERHMTIHTGVKAFNCEICGQAFRLAYQVKSHMLIHQPDLKPLQCPCCEKGYRDRASFNKHVKSHEHDVVVPDHLIVLEAAYDQMEN